MIATSTVVMYGLMYLNTYAFEHVRFSETRLYMALLMGAVMAIVMLLFMRGMYENRRINVAIVIGGVMMFATSLWLVRSQRTVGDIAYMQAMIPHHSIAVMTSERAQIRDPRVRKLADGILETQIREIGEMNGLIADLRAHPTPANAPVLSPFDLAGGNLKTATIATRNPWTPVGYWAENSELCPTGPWLIARARTGPANSSTCILRRPEAATTWLAHCSSIGLTEIRRSDRGDQDQITVRNPHGNAALLLTRCVGPHSTADVQSFDSILSKATSLDRRIAEGALARESVATADGIFLVRSWRDAGEIVKITAPVGAGAEAGLHRAFYFNPGDATPYLIRGPSAAFVVEEGRFAAWFGPKGRLISTLVPTEPDARERSLMRQASTLRRLAEPILKDEAARG
jgi:hypothetical protein